MTTHKLNEREIVAVKGLNKFIQKDTIYINKANCLRYTKFEHRGDSFPKHQTSLAIQLPPGSWSILGRRTDVTEEVARGLVECYGYDNGYRNYQVYSQYMEGLKKTALESFHSWCDREGITDELLIIKNK